MLKIYSGFSSYFSVLEGWRLWAVPYSYGAAIPNAYRRSLFGQSVAVRDSEIVLKFRSAEDMRRQSYVREEQERKTGDRRRQRVVKHGRTQENLFLSKGWKHCSQPKRRGGKKYFILLHKSWNIALDKTRTSQKQNKTLKTAKRVSSETRWGGRKL